jgi:hypothetical protein
VVPLMLVIVTRFPEVPDTVNEDTAVVLPPSNLKVLGGLFTFMSL